MIGSLTKLFEEEAKRAAHIMGLDGSLRFKPSEDTGAALMSVVAQPHGSLSDSTLQYLNENLDAYLPTLPDEKKEDWRKIKTAFQLARQEVDGKVPEERAKKQIQRMQAGAPELIHLGDSWWRAPHAHAVGVTFYGDYMVVCNRGLAGDRQDCTKVFKIDPKSITQQQLIDLQRIPSQDTLLRTINEIAGGKPPIATFPSTTQKFGTCNYVNRLSSIEAMLCLVKLHREGKLNDSEIKKYSEENENRKTYKAFTKHSRDKEVDRIIGKMQKSTDPQIQALYANLALEIIKKRKPLQEKDQDSQKGLAEKERMDKLTKAVTDLYPNLRDQPNISTANKEFYNNLIMENKNVNGLKPLMSLMKEVLPKNSKDVKLLPSGTTATPGTQLRLDMASYFKSENIDIQNAMKKTLHECGIVFQELQRGDKKFLTVLATDENLSAIQKLDSDKFKNEFAKQLEIVKSSTDKSKEEEPLVVHDDKGKEEQAKKEQEAKAEQEARAKAEQEARAKAEQEARAKAEQEARSGPSHSFLVVTPPPVTFSHTPHKAPPLVSLVHDASNNLSKIKAYLDVESNRKEHHITKVEDHQVGFKPKAGVKLEIKAPGDEKPSTVYIDENPHGGVNYGIDKNASPEQRARSIQSICEIAVANSSLETEFDLTNTPNEMKAAVQDALEKAIKAKYPDPEKAPKLKTSESDSHKLKAG